MTGTNKGIVLPVLCGIIVFSLFFPIDAGTLMASEPLLLIYPDEPTVFRYDPSRYQLLSPLDPEFDELFAITNQVLWDKVEGRIPSEIYRAPQLQGFQPSPYGMNEFVLMRNEFNIIINGYNPMPRTYTNLHMRFIPMPSYSNVQIFLSSQLVEGLIATVPDLHVSTPTGDGNYADTMNRHIYWSGAMGLRITVYSDKDGDGLYSDGEPLCSILVEDNTVSTQESTWGAVKALYRGNR